MSLLNRMAAEARQRAQRIQEAHESGAEGNRIRTSGLRPAATVNPVTGRLQSGMPELEPGYLRRIVEGRDTKAQRSRVGMRGAVHASLLTGGVCTRQYALMRRFEIEHREALTSGHQIMFATGRTIEDHIRSAYIDASSGKVYGNWRCKCGALEHVGVRPADKVCGVCNTPANRYRELTVFDDENGIAGNCDMPVMLRDWLIPYEVKSMAKSQWEVLTAPKPDHVGQVLAYHYLYSKNGFKVHSHVGLIYCQKEFRYGSPYKEFHVDATAPENVDKVARMVESAREIKEAHKTGVMPPRIPACPEPDSATAKKCPACAACFQLRE
jgi:hypothetical protein